MGYDVKRFVGVVIDKRLICQICSSVLQDPVETPCKHLFCTICIDHWLSRSATCPIDRQPLGTHAFKKPGRMLHTFLARLEIKCDFQEQGCGLIVTLEDLPKHLLTCNYRPYSLITCDQGCNLEILRQDQAKSCDEHMSEQIRLQEMEIRKLRHDVMTLSHIRKVQQDELNRIIGPQSSSQ